MSPKFSEMLFARYRSSSVRDETLASRRYFMIPVSLMREKIKALVSVADCSNPSRETIV